MARRNSRRLLQFEPPREAMAALSQDERQQVRGSLAAGEEVLATVRAWFGEHRRAWALTSRHVLVLGEGSTLLGSYPLDDVSRLDCEPCGVGTALWLYTSHQLVELHLASPEDAETFAATFERIQRDAMVLRIVR
jgi:hypothetical protein